MNTNLKICVEVVHCAIKITVTQVLLSCSIMVSILKKECQLQWRCMFLYIYFLSSLYSSLKESNKKDTLYWLLCYICATAYKFGMVLVTVFIYFYCFYDQIIIMFLSYNMWTNNEKVNYNIWVINVVIMLLFILLKIKNKEFLPVIVVHNIA